MSDQPVWQFHAKYQRQYRDFYSNEDDKWYRQYDNLQGKLTEIPAKAIQQTVAHEQSVPRTVQPIQYSRAPATVQSTPIPPIPGDPWGARTGSTQFNYSVAPQMNQSDQTTASLAQDDETPNREPWGSSRGSTDVQQPEQEDYILKTGTQKGRGKSQTRRDHKNLEQAAAPPQRDETEEMKRERTPSRTRPLQAYKKDGKPQRRGSRPTQSRPEETRKSSFSRRGNDKDADFSSQFGAMSLNSTFESAVEEGEDDQGSPEQDPLLRSSTRTYSMSGTSGINQTEYDSNNFPIDPVPVEEDHTAMTARSYPHLTPGYDGMSQPLYGSDPSTDPIAHERQEQVQPSYISHQNMSSTSPTMSSVGFMRPQYGQPQRALSASQATPYFSAGNSQHAAHPSFQSPQSFAEPVHGQTGYGRSYDFAIGGATSNPTAQSESEGEPTTSEPQLGPVSVDSPESATLVLSGLGKKGYEIKGSKGQAEPLDKNYFKRDKPKPFFRVGRVFAMLWHENVGRDGTIISGPNISMGPFREVIYSSVRRMIVVREGNGFCWCLPVSTYNGRATTKPGLNPQSHAIVYSNDSHPARLPNETGMNKQSLAVDCVQGQKLDPLSRVNFDKVYTVEHNVKVMNIGKIAEASLPKLTGYWRIHKDY